MKKQEQVQRLKETLYVTLGAFILAISVNLIFLPNQIVAGGASGLSIVLNELFGWNVALTLYAINIPLLILCFLLLGKDVGLKTIYGSLINPFFIAITGSLPPLTNNIFLATLYGGVLTGIGLGLVFRGNASTGGSAIISQIVNKYFKISLGVSVFVVDGFVIATALFVFTKDTVLFSLISLFIIGRVIDRVQVGVLRSKNLFIISDKYEAIHQMFIKELDKGVTLLPIEGGYTQKQGKIIMTVIPEKEFMAIKEAILAIDETAFFVALDASEVNGRGFSVKRMMEDYSVEI
ncbi:YitT family protein [Enterococcus aquimarinus]|uniref:YitT family protein n=1 Tax=Enterococcus aquimarinus TaxID=328396 RepID=A0A1L8QUM6_9ENTE|nr:YitT family protein [Enterococcus aquimarinus]OJG11221.1 YitT family protein [Enterococcus aquimarinus]HRM23095.1 YitT family protein [Enterococcus aquimarinus]